MFLKTVLENSFRLWLYLVDIVSYTRTRYSASSKQRILSSEQSEADDNTNTMREDGSTTNFSENNDFFLEGLKSDDCRSFLLNSFKNIQEQIEELFVMVRKITNAN